MIEHPMPVYMLIRSLLAEPLISICPRFYSFRCFTLTPECCCLSFQLVASFAHELQSPLFRDRRDRRGEAAQDSGLGSPVPSASSQSLEAGLLAHAREP